ncbi:hypothetical protein CDAR_53751 [Caerostris darwini]|uniref:Uncharacterized protein n=1 Tax=Caerostris darwini TaxID=1538125 RepID=A0AAV4VTE5_9ARAC|nr:hypothetical protein CDAR_53751 [Caerostris darwini]
MLWEDLEMSNIMPLFSIGEHVTIIYRHYYSTLLSKLHKFPSTKTTTKNKKTCKEEMHSTESSDVPYHHPHFRRPLSVRCPLSCTGSNLHPRHLHPYPN